MSDQRITAAARDQPDGATSCYAGRAMHRFALTLILLLPGCCSSCGCGAIAPQAGGPTPYARCAIADAPAARETRVGDLTLRLEDRELRIDGLPETFPIALARGPAPAATPIASALASIEASGARLMIVMGSLGDDEPSAIASVAALAQLPVPVLILAGGRDEPAHLRAAIEALDERARPRVIDVSALRRVRLSSQLVLVPVAGAPNGRYARADMACGIGQDDLDEIAGELGEPGDERRLLLSWAAPAGSPAAIGIEGGAAGSEPIAVLARTIGAEGGLLAWPEAQAGRIVGEGAGSYAVAAAIAGPAVVRADGSRAPSGVMLLRVGPESVLALGSGP